jgi:diacylglycerol O-acyltransferase
MGSVTLRGPARRMSSFDAGFLYFERPHAPLSIGCIAVLEAGLSCSELVRHFEGRLGALRRYTQRVVPAPLSLAHPSWEDDPEFDVRNHVHRWSVPAPGGEAELCGLIEELMPRPLERTRPLWEAHLLDGLEGGRAALLQKVHHCMIDGVAGTGVLETLLDPGATPGAPPGGRPPAAWRPEALRLLDAIASATLPVRRSFDAFGTLRRPARVLEGLRPLGEVAGWTLRRLLDGPSGLPWNGRIGPRRRMLLTRLSLDDARAIGAAHGASINDVVLATLGGGLRRYLEALGIEPNGRTVTALVPVSLRTPGERDALGNRIGALLVRLAVGPSDEVERLAATGTITRRLKQGGGFRGVATLLAAGDLLPAPLAAWAGGHLRVPDVASLVATNVPGPRQPRFLCGRRVEALYPIVPITDGLGLGVAVLSYAGGLYVGLNADADCAPDLDVLKAGLEESFACLSATL